MAVRITTLGTLRIELDGKAVDRLPAARNRSALLAYLAVEREVTRDGAMGLLWPDRPPDRARHLLSQTLYELRQELGEAWVDVQGEHLRATDALECDAVDLVEAIDAGDHERAMELYAGPFLPGAALAVSRPMEGWIDTHRARLVRLHRRACRDAIDARVADDRLAEAVAVTRSWVEADPLDDEAQHRLIELLAATGDRSGALRQYEEYAQLVEQELELEPLDETRELMERIRNGDVGERRTPRVSEPKPAYAAASDAPAAPAPQTSPEASRRETAARPDSGEDSLLDWLAGLRHRRTVRWTLAYVATAVLVLEGTDILTDAFGLPPQILRGLALLLAVGAIGVLGGSWYLADKGRTFGKAEVALTVLVAVFVLSLPTWFGRAAPAPPTNGQGLDPNRLAVLYFDDMSADGSLTHLAAGFTEALIHELSQVDGLHVLSRRAVARFRGNESLSYDSLVAELRAGILVEGSLSHVGDSIRLTIQLIDGETASHLMSTTLQSSRDSADQLLVAMPEEAARLLRRRLGDWVRVRQMETAATSARALEIVQRVELMLRDSRELRWTDLNAGLSLLQRADSLLTEAERVDPQWPKPIMMRAEVASQRALATASIPSHYEPTATAAAFAHLNRVLERWPAYPPALAMRGNLRYGLAESGGVALDSLPELYRLAEADLRKAVIEDPDLTDGWWGLSKVLLNTHEYAEARQAAVRAVDTDAFLTADPKNLLHLFSVTFSAEDHSAAVHWCDQLEKRYPGNANHLYCELFLLTSSPLVSPDVDKAWQVSESIVASMPRADQPIYAGYTAIQTSKVIIRAGMPDSARMVLERAVPDTIPDWAAYDLGHALLLLGEDDRAMDVLEQWFAFHPIRAKRLAEDWWFSRLHGHPRFEEMVGIGPG